MKQKVVIKVSMNDQKYRKKALKTVVGCIGVESAALQGADKDQIEVIGDGIDAVEITTLLRKNVGNSDIVSVSPVTDKKEDGKKDGAKESKIEPTPPVIWTAYPYHPIYEVKDPNYDPCTIM